MGLTEDITFVRSALDAFESVDAPHMGVASVDGSGGVPPEMYDGEIDEEGWVAWRMLPSTLTEADISKMESELSITFPPLFRAYLLAGYQLFDQVHSSLHNQLIFNTDVPSNDPLGPIQRLIQAWMPLLSAGFIPFAEWGDGWGPMCFDIANRDSDGDCPVVWMDHEILISLGPEKCGDRNSVLPHVNPLYNSYREFIDDVFSPT